LRDHCRAGRVDLGVGRDLGQQDAQAERCERDGAT
jgi:hypothetical protein